MVALLPAASCGGEAHYSRPLPDRDAPADAGPDDLGASCVGLRPDESAFGAEPGPQRAPEPDAGAAIADAGAGCSPAACQGAEAPSWALPDFQPRSCGQGATYGLDAFRGKVTVVALLEAW